MSAPKTLYLSATAVPGVPGAPAVVTGLSLGWFVVLQSPDEARRGTLLEVSAPVVVLSRDVRRVRPDEEWFVINDEFMSGGHAVVRRPRGTEPTEGFTIQDRSDPGPSANGTFVNLQKLGPGEVAQLSDGDVVRLGTTELMFKSLWLPPAAPRRA